MSKDSTYIKQISILKHEYGREISDSRYIFETEFLGDMDDDFHKEYDDFCKEVRYGDYLEYRGLLEKRHDILEISRKKYDQIQEELKNGG